MFGITKLLNALTRLARGFNGLAETVETVNTATRVRLQLDYAVDGPGDDEAGVPNESLLTER